MLSKKQRMISVAALGVLIVFAVLLNIGAMHMSQKESPTQAVSAQMSSTDAAVPEKKAGNLTFVAEYRAQREQTRQEETRYLETILQDEKTDDMTRRAAQEKLMEIVDHSETELAIETLLEAKGFTGVAVAVQKEMINIILEAEKLDDSQVAQILEIAMREGRVGAENVKIIPTSLKES